jgi:hypothetical protein
MSSTDSKGLQEVADGCHAYLQADGSWGWSNAGLIVGDGVSLLVDTLFDLKLTQKMLDSMRPITLASPITQVVNTHANGDHCFGNILLDDTEIISSTATAHEMTEVPPALLAGLNSALGDVGDMFRSFFGAFDFDGIELRLRSNLRRTDRSRCRRPRCRVDRGRPGTHRRRHTGVRPRCPHDLHRRHLVHRRHADRVGRSVG